MKIILSALIVMASGILSAQKPGQTNNRRDYVDKPIWIQMMNDPGANYFETIKSFREFWKDRNLPKEPFENEGMDSFEREVGLITDGKSEEEREREEKRRQKNRNQDQADYSAEVRAFKGWMQLVKPWVRQDGSIVSPEEQQDIVNRQVREQREIEIKNGRK